MRPYEIQTLDHRCFTEIMWLTNKHSLSVRALVVVYRYCKSFVDQKSFVGLKTDDKRIYIATYHEYYSLSCHDVIILGD